MPYRSEEHTSELQSHDNLGGRRIDRKSTRLNSSHTIISYAVFCLKKKTKRVASSAPSRSALSHFTRSPQIFRGSPLPPLAEYFFLYVSETRLAVLLSLPTRT